MAALHRLPYELLRDILDRCDTYTIIQFACVNRAWCLQILGDDLLWQQKYQSTFGLSIEEAEWRAWYLGTDAQFVDEWTQYSQQISHRNAKIRTTWASSIEDGMAKHHAWTSQHSSEAVDVLTGTPSGDSTPTHSDHILEARDQLSQSSECTLARSPFSQTLLCHQWDSGRRSSLESASSARTVVQDRLHRRSRRYHNTGYSFQTLQFSWFSMYARRLELENNFLWACLGDHDRCQIPNPPPSAKWKAGDLLTVEREMHPVACEHRRYHRCYHQRLGCTSSLDPISSKGATDKMPRKDRHDSRQLKRWSSWLSLQNNFPNLHLTSSLRRSIIATAGRLSNLIYAGPLSSDEEKRMETEYTWRLTLMPHFLDAQFYHACHHFCMQPSIEKLVAEAAPPTAVVYLWRVEKPRSSSHSRLRQLVTWPRLNGRRCTAAANLTQANEDEQCVEEDQDMDVLWIVATVDAYTKMLTLCRERSLIDWWLTKDDHSDEMTYQTESMLENPHSLSKFTNIPLDRLQLHIDHRISRTLGARLSRSADWQRQRKRLGPEEVKVADRHESKSRNSVSTRTHHVSAIPMGFRLLRRHSPATASLYEPDCSSVNAPAHEVRLVKCGHVLSGDAHIVDVHNTALSVDILHAIERQRYPLHGPDKTAICGVIAAHRAKAGNAVSASNAASTDPTFTTPYDCCTSPSGNFYAGDQPHLLPHIWSTRDPITGRYFPVVLLTSPRSFDYGPGELTNDALW